MGEDTKIPYVQYTFNPWRGCTKVPGRAGCQNCYAERQSARNPAVLGRWGAGQPRVRAAESYLHQPFRWDREAENTGTRPRVMCGSLMDWLDPEVPAEWRAGLLETIFQTPNLDWLLFTKRQDKFFELVTKAGSSVTETAPTNVWIISSAEDQSSLDRVVPDLLKIPAKVRGLSLEPLLGPVNLEPWLGDCGGRRTGAVMGVQWVIVGGESGPKARPCNVEWIRSIVRQCKAASVPCYVKQLGSFATISNETDMCGYTMIHGAYRLNTNHSKGGDPSEWLADLRVRQFPSPSV